MFATINQSKFNFLFPVYSILTGLFVCLTIEMNEEKKNYLQIHQISNKMQEKRNETKEDRMIKKMNELINFTTH